MTLRQLELFIAVAETGSFSRGAELMHLTQSTVSQHISALEDAAGSRLLDRDRNGSQLTTAGRLFLRHARRVLAERELLVQALAAFNGLQETSLTIGASNIPANCLIPNILPPLVQRYPGIKLTVQAGDSQQVLEMLLAAEIELAVVGGRSEEKKIDFIPLTNDLLVLVVGAAHPWFQRQEITIAELATADFIMREVGSGSESALQRELQRVGIDRSRQKVVARLGSNEAIRRTLTSGFGCAFVSERSVQRELASGDLCLLPVAGMRVERQFWLASLKGRSPSPAAAAVGELLLQQFSTAAK